LLGNIPYFPRPVRSEKIKRKRNERLSSNHTRTTRFTRFTTEGYVHRVATDFTMMDKTIQEIFTIQRC
jgi:hypothetical protein